MQNILYTGRKKIQGGDNIHSYTCPLWRPVDFRGNTPLQNWMCLYVSHLPSGTNAILIRLRIQLLKPKEIWSDKEEYPW
jgi:hypothetical protein